MRVAALMIVRDEADVLAINLAHHRATGDRRLLDRRQRLDRRDAEHPAEGRSGERVDQVAARRRPLRATGDDDRARPRRAPCRRRLDRRHRRRRVLGHRRPFPPRDPRQGRSRRGHPGSRCRQLRAGALGHHRRPGCAAHHDPSRPRVGRHQCRGAVAGREPPRRLRRDRLSAQGGVPRDRRDQRSRPATTRSRVWRAPSRRRARSCACTRRCGHATGSR